jgi:hypothetical protein
VVCDRPTNDAHYFGGELKYTKRYKLGQASLVSNKAFSTSYSDAPHGKEEDFQLFMALLDRTALRGSSVAGPIQPTRPISCAAW